MSCKPLEEPAIKTPDAGEGAGPKEMLGGTTGRGRFRSLKLFRILLRKDNDIERARKLNREVYNLFKDIEETEGASSEEPRGDNPIQEDASADGILQEIFKASHRNHELAKVRMGDVGRTNPGEGPGTAAREDATTDNYDPMDTKDPREPDEGSGQEDPKLQKEAPENPGLLNFTM